MHAQRENQQFHSIERKVRDKYYISYALCVWNKILLYETKSNVIHYKLLRFVTNVIDIDCP